MTKWIEWTREYYNLRKSMNIERLYQMCMKIGAGQVDIYNKRCRNGQLCQEYSCWPECDSTKLLTSCSAYFTFVWGQGSSWCATPPDPNYAAGCAAGKAANIAEADAKLKSYEDLYKSGNSVPELDAGWGISIAFGCSAYSSQWGCPEWKDIGNQFLRTAVGFNQIPVYEQISVPHLKGPNLSDYNSFNAWNLVTALYEDKIKQWTDNLKQQLGKSQIANYDLNKAGYQGFRQALVRKLTKDHPILVVEESPYAYALTIISGMRDYNSAAIYLMVHNLGSTEKRDFAIVFPCPTAITKEEYQKWLALPSCSQPYECPYAQSGE